MADWRFSTSVDQVTNSGSLHRLKSTNSSNINAEPNLQTTASGKNSESLHSPESTNSSNINFEPNLQTIVSESGLAKDNVRFLINLLRFTVSVANVGFINHLEKNMKNN